jgi:hypothetical protein
MRKLKREVRHEFTAEELDSKRDELAETTIEIGRLKDAAKADAAERKEEIDTIDSRRKQLSKEILARGEDRLVECLVRYNIPRPGRKRILRVDDGSIVEDDQPMADEEMQAHLFTDADLVDLEKLYGGDGPNFETAEPGTKPAAPTPAEPELCANCKQAYDQHGEETACPTVPGAKWFPESLALAMKEKMDGKTAAAGAKDEA